MIANSPSSRKPAPGRAATAAIVISGGVVAVREGLAKPKTVPPYEHDSYDMGQKLDVTNIGDVIGLLDETDLPC